MKSIQVFVNEDHLKVQIPDLGIDTIAKDEQDVYVAIGEAVMISCIASDKFGKGLKQELLNLWSH